MKQIMIRVYAVVFALALLAPASLLAQKDEKDKDKELKEKREAEQIIITRKGDKTDKVTVEINGDKVTINGKPLDEFKDDDVSVRRNKFKDFDGLTLNRVGVGRDNFWNGGNDAFSYFSMDSNHAMLGVTTEKAEGGVKIEDITKESGAEKAGLKEGDVITKIGDIKIEDPDDLSKAVREHKPGDKVVITYLRDKKEQKATAELTKWKGANVWTMTPDMDMNLNMKLDKIMPKIQNLQGLRTPYGQNWSWSGGGPKLGLSVQDTDDGKGVKVIDVDDEGNANKAGIKEDDIITEVDGKAVNSADEIAKIIRDSKDKVSVMFKLQRSGKTQNIEVKIPRRLKTADL